MFIILEAENQFFLSEIYFYFFFQFVLFHLMNAYILNPRSW